MEQVEQIQAIEQSDDVENDMPVSIEQVESAPEDVPEDVQQYTANNSELDAFIQDASETQAEKKQAEQQHAIEGDYLPKDEAAQFAVTGILHTVNFFRQQTGEDLKLSNMQLTIFASTLTPLVMKYGASVQRFITEGLENIGEDDGHLPEYVALGGAAGLAGSLWWQCRSARKKRAKGLTHGN